MTRYIITRSGLMAVCEPEPQRIEHYFHPEDLMPDGKIKSDRTKFKEYIASLPKYRKRKSHR